MFPKRLKQLRKERKLTQEELGKKINVSKVSISGYESGSRNPDTETLKKIADLFDVSIDYLLGRSNAIYSQDESEFLEDIKGSSINELATKFDLTVDGQKATKEEIDTAIALIKTLRASSQDKE